MSKSPLVILVLSLLGAPALGSPIHQDPDQTHQDPIHQDPDQICQAVKASTSARLPTYRPDMSSRIQICMSVVRVSLGNQLDPTLAAVLAWEESRWEPVQRNPKTKVVGPLQVQPRWWCPNKTEQGCDFTLAGVLAVRHYLRKHQQQGEVVGLCHYNQGNICGPRALRRAKMIYSEVLSARRRLRSPNT